MVEYPESWIIGSHWEVVTTDQTWEDYSWNDTCPGYWEEACGQPADYAQLLLNDPRAFCLGHAKASTQFWNEVLGFPPPQFLHRPTQHIGYFETITIPFN